MKFYSFEGLDGCGKSTAMASVAEMLRSDGYEVITTREPGGTPLGEAIRNYLLKDTSIAVCKHAEALLFAASRTQLYNELILPNKDNDIIILCDRFIDSSIAYQGIGYDLGASNVIAINDFGINGFRPDKVFYLKVSAAERKKRLGATAPDKIESRDGDFFSLAEKGFEVAHTLYKMESDHSVASDITSQDRFVTIDGSNAPNVVASEIYQYIKADRSIKVSNHFVTE